MFFVDPQWAMLSTLIFVRVSAILFALPIIGEEPTPVRVRVLLAAAVAIPLIVMSGEKSLLAVSRFQTDVFSIAMLVVKEIAIGLVIGYVARCIFHAVLMGASLIGYQMGFGTATLFMPGVDEQQSSFTMFHRLIVILMFLALNLHHLYFHALFQTFTIVPPGMMQIQATSLPLILRSTADIFTVALQLASPVLTTTMLATAALGLVARTVPQFQVFTLSFPVNFFLGLGTYWISLAFLPGWLRDSLTPQGEMVLQLIKTMAPRG